jgi:hypothetical protein
MQRQVRGILDLLRPHVLRRLVRSMPLITWWPSRTKRCRSIDLEAGLGFDGSGRPARPNGLSSRSKSLGSAMRHHQRTLIEIDAKHEADAHVAVGVASDGGLRKFWVRRRLGSCRRVRTSQNRLAEPTHQEPSTARSRQNSGSSRLQRRMTGEPGVDERSHSTNSKGDRDARLRGRDCRRCCGATDGRNRGSGCDSVF